MVVKLAGFTNKWDELKGLIPGFVQETRHKYQGLFKDFPAPNLMFSRTIFFN